MAVPATAAQVVPLTHTCTPSQLRLLPYEPADVFTYYGARCVCLRYQCPICGAIHLQSRYYPEETMRPDMTRSVKPPPDGKPYEYSAKTLAWLDKRQARSRIYHQRSRAKHSQMKETQ